MRPRRSTLCQGPELNVLLPCTFHLRPFSERQDSPTRSKEEREPDKGGVVSRSLVGGNGSMVLRLWRQSRLGSHCSQLRGPWVTSLTSDPVSPQEGSRDRDLVGDKGRRCGVGGWCRAGSQRGCPWQSRNLPP